LVFGGLVTVVVAVFCIHNGQVIVRATTSIIDQLAIKISESTGNSGPIEGTTIAGMKRLVRYSASEEEDLINAASASSKTVFKGVSAQAYLLRDLSTGQIVDSRNSEKLIPIASLTKLVTAAVAHRLISGISHVTITDDIVSTYGNTAQFRKGETFLADDLYYPLLMVSSNDAAEAFARTYGRGNFIKAMNDFAQSIGAYRTRFVDPSGLSADNISTAHDMAIILDWLRQNDPDLISITELKAKTIRFHTWINPTHFLSWSNYLGGKNGYTTEADRTSALLFAMGPKRDVYAVVVLGSSERDPDVIQLLERVKE